MRLAASFKHLVGLAKADADVPGRRFAEARARHDRHLLGVEQAPGEFLAVGLDRADVEHHIHAAFRSAHGDVVHAAHGIEEHRAPPGIERGDLFDAIAVLECSGGSAADEIVEPVGRDQVQADQQRDEIGRAGQPADAPAGHAMALRQRIDDQRALRHAVQRARRDVLAAAQRPVDLVGQQPEIAPAAQLGDRLERGARIDRAGRVVRRVEQDRLGLRRQRLLDRCGARLEAVLGRRLDDGEIGAGSAECAGVCGVVGRHDDRMVARVEHALHGSVERRLAARRGDHLCGRGGDAGGARRDLGHRFAQCRNAGELRVVVMAGAHRGDASLDGLGRRVEIMVADRQHDDSPRRPACETSRRNGPPSHPCR